MLQTSQLVVLRSATTIVNRTLTRTVIDHHALEALDVPANATKEWSECMEDRRNCSLVAANAITHDERSLNAHERWLRGCVGVFTCLASFA